MAYEIDIKRPDRGCFTLDEWKLAVSGIADLRFDASVFVAINPRTGAEVRVPGNKGNVAMYFEDSHEWFKVFCWHDGSVSFKARGATDDVWRVASEFATKLGAQVVGEAGERYGADGEPIRN